MLKTKHLIIGILGGCLLAACGQKTPAARPAALPQEDLQAKKLLQGIWVGDDDGDVAFRVHGDSIFYPDSTSLPVTFRIVGDTLVMSGTQEVCYAILRQSPHIFEFRNQNGDVVRLVKSDDEEDTLSFANRSPRPINQNRLMKRDTVVMAQSTRYHCYVQVNPTTYKVYKTTYNDEGVSVDNVYFDNIINLAVFKGSQRLFSSDFHKNDFRRHVPAGVLKQSILSDMTFNRTDAEGIHYDAEICIPDSPSSYIVEVVVKYDGSVVFRNHQ